MNMKPFKSLFLKTNLIAYKHKGGKRVGHLPLPPGYIHGLVKWPCSLVIVWWYRGQSS